MDGWRRCRQDLGIVGVIDAIESTPNRVISTPRSASSFTGLLVTNKPGNYPL